MKSYIALALAATALATPMPQADTKSGCPNTSDQTFQIQTAEHMSKRELKARQLDGALTMTLKDGILKDQAGRQGYIASNYQFQFDPKPQPNALQTNGFGLCSNESLALGGGIPRPFGDTTWWQCKSGDFYNLYSDSQGMQCIKIFIQAVNGGSGSASQSSAQGVASATQSAVSQIPDGQPQASSAAPKPVTQITDGQPQASTPAPSPKPAVTQISDGQPQASAPKPAVTQISDGQPQASAPKPAVTQISDGQPQASAPKPAVTQISDGQPQASAPAASPKPAVTQISDGQPQASAPAASPKPAVTQISDGQPQVSAPGNLTGLKPTASAPAQFTGAAAVSNVGMGAFAAGMFGLFALL